MRTTELGYVAVTKSQWPLTKVYFLLVAYVQQGLTMTQLHVIIFYTLEDGETSI